MKTNKTTKFVFVFTFLFVFVSLALHAGSVCRIIKKTETKAISDGRIRELSSFRAQREIRATCMSFSYPTVIITISSTLQDWRRRMPRWSSVPDRRHTLKFCTSMGISIIFKNRRGYNISFPPKTCTRIYRMPTRIFHSCGTHRDASNHSPRK